MRSAWRYLLKMALGATRDASAAGTSSETSRTELDKCAEKILAKLDWGLAERVLPGVNEIRQTYMTSAVEPRASELPALMAGKVPASLANDSARFEAARINLQQTTTETVEGGLFG